MPASLRLATPDDAPALLSIYAPLVRETAISLERTPPDAAAFRARIRDTLEERPWLVCEAGGAVAGYAYASPHRSRAGYRWAVESSVYVRAEHRRRGVATALYTALFGVLAAQGYYTVYAGTVLPNPASTALHRAVGFEPVGTYRAVGHKQGAWHDVQWWQRPLQDDRPAAPEPPRPITAITGGPAYEEALAAGRAHLEDGAAD